MKTGADGLIWLRILVIRFAVILRASHFHKGLWLFSTFFCSHYCGIEVTDTAVSKGILAPFKQVDLPLHMIMVLGSWAF